MPIDEHTLWAAVAEHLNELYKDLNLYVHAYPCTTFYPNLTIRSRIHNSKNYYASELILHGRGRNITSSPNSTVRLDSFNPPRKIRYRYVDISHPDFLDHINKIVKDWYKQI
jgi:hypothetical protein